MGWRKEKTTKERETVASVPSPLSLVSITVSQQMVRRMGMKGGKKKGEKAPRCHSFRFSLPLSTKKRLSPDIQAS